LYKEFVKETDPFFSVCYQSTFRIYFSNWIV